MLKRLSIPIGLCLWVPTLVFVVCIAILIILLVVIPLSFYKKNDDNNEYLDENGNHRYYDRSIIEKEDFIKNNSKVSPKDLRT
ncbi:MAG: hypothetical protein J1F67_11660 [Muribaculaceae bacterium]|nr:hypothetical protein [Muribaculaceae bacterium]